MDGMFDAVLFGLIFVAVLSVLIGFTMTGKSRRRRRRRIE